MNKVEAIQVARFIPMSSQVKTLKNDKFYFFLENEMRDLFTEVKKRL